jgi:hypothetical protein
MGKTGLLPAQVGSGFTRATSHLAGTDRNPVICCLGIQWCVFFSVL